MLPESYTSIPVYLSYGENAFNRILLSSISTRLEDIINVFTIAPRIVRLPEQVISFVMDKLPVIPDDPETWIPDPSSCPRICCPKSRTLTFLFFLLPSSRIIGIKSSEFRSVTEEKSLILTFNGIYHYKYNRNILYTTFLKSFSTIRLTKDSKFILGFHPNSLLINSLFPSNMSTSAGL